MQMLLPLYRVEKKLTDSNSIIRKVVTNYLQCIHRTKLKSEKHLSDKKYIDEIDPKNNVCVPSPKDEIRGTELCKIKKLFGLQVGRENRSIIPQTPD